MTKSNLHNPENLAFEEIIDIIQSKHVVAEQLNIFAAHAKHETAELKRKIEALDEISRKVDARLKELDDEIQSSST